MENKMANEKINHPSHYNTGNIETIEVIEDWDLNFCLGNAVKYISRAGKKDKDKYKEDLSKAYWYIMRNIVNQSNLNPQKKIKKRYKNNLVEIETDWHLSNNLFFAISNIFYSINSDNEINKIQYLLNAASILKKEINS